MDKKRVLVAMSGGVDSSVAAAMLIEQGYEVEGATMQIWPDITDEEERCTNGCCSLSAVDDARRVANLLGIKYHVLNFKEQFERDVIDPFVKEYIAGRTPNPCVMCNRTVKFEEFLRRAKTLGFDYICTGHYGLVETGQDGRMLLRRSVTAEKDQTYALFTLTQEQLSHLLLPVGRLTKPEVREYARKLCLPVSDKPDSQEICFVKDNDYAGFIEKRGYECRPGNFVDLDGKIIGKHKGIIHYTIGQRKGLGGGFAKPMFVVRIDVEKNEVVLGGNEDTFKNDLIAKDLNWIYKEPIEPFKCKAKIRYNGPSADCTVYPHGDTVRVEFDSPARAVTPGQFAVFYDGDYVIGGGTIIG